MKQIICYMTAYGGMERTEKESVLSCGTTLRNFTVLKKTKNTFLKIRFSIDILTSYLPNKSQAFHCLNCRIFQKSPSSAFLIP